MALNMVMALSLLVCSLAERNLRKTLVTSELATSAQKRRPIKTPTIHWVFQKFEEVLILYVIDSGSVKLIQHDLMQDHVTAIECSIKHIEKMCFIER
jgi:hypothetical protein